MKNRVRIDVLFLTALLALRVLIVPAIFVDYQLRKAYIARYLCENRHRPELHCDGKCYLAKRLKAAQEQEQSQKGQELLRFLFELPFVPQGSPSLPGQRVPEQEFRAFLAYDARLSTGCVTLPFHPPCA
jgi:hypothetical protein